MKFDVVYNDVDENGNIRHTMDKFKYKEIHVHKNKDVWMTEREWDNAEDSLLEGYDPICKGEDGKLYIVHFNWDKKPLLWQEVEPRV